MDSAGDATMVVKNQSGQTMVEYILLLVVAISLVITFYNSEAYRRLFGEQGEIGKKIKQESEFSYRHAFIEGRPATDNLPSRDISNHPSYKDTEDGGTRFFGPIQAYP